MKTTAENIRLGLQGCKTFSKLWLTFLLCLFKIYSKHTKLYDLSLYFVCILLFIGLVRHVL